MPLDATPQRPANAAREAVSRFPAVGDQVRVSSGATFTPFRDALGAPVLRALPPSSRRVEVAAPKRAHVPVERDAAMHQLLLDLADAGALLPDVRQLARTLGPGWGEMRVRKALNNLHAEGLVAHQSMPGRFGVDRVVRIVACGRVLRSAGAPSWMKP